jgi:hypothetical protein
MLFYRTLAAIRLALEGMASMAAFILSLAA